MSPDHLTQPHCCVVIWEGMPEPKGLDKIFYLPNFQSVDPVTMGALGCLIVHLFKEMVTVLSQKIPLLHFSYIFILRVIEKG